MKYTNRLRKPETWWVEFLEGELSQDDLAEAKQVLLNSETDREMVHELAALKSLLRSTDDVAIPKKQNYHAQLKEKILSGISLDLARVDEEDTSSNVLLPSALSPLCSP